MTEPTETDEFEKYFLKSPNYISKIRGEEILRRGSLPEAGKKDKKNKDRRGSSYKQSAEPNKQSRKSVSNVVTTDGSSCFLLRPDLNVCDASSLPNSRQGSLKLSKTRSSKDIQEELLKVSECPSRRSSLTPEEITEQKLKEIKQLEDDNFFVVRSFLTSPKGLVNRGDSFKKNPHKETHQHPPPPPPQRKNSEASRSRRLSEVARGHRSSVHSTSSATISDVISANASATSDPIELESVEKIGQLSERPSIEITRCFFPDEAFTPGAKADAPVVRPALKRLVSRESPRTVVVLGEHRVGKTSLVTQFLTSEHLVGLDTCHDESSIGINSTISVSVDGVETLLNFIDADVKDYLVKELNVIELENFPHAKEFAAFLVVYSITDASSFHVACNLVENLCGRSDRRYSVILVANKGDLVRNRKVLDSDAKDVCTKCGCKFIEISAGLNHKTDELLVGIVCQVRLNNKRMEMKPPSSQGKPASHKSTSYFGWFKKLFGLKGKAEEFHCTDLHSL